MNVVLHQDSSPRKAHDAKENGEKASCWSIQTKKGEGFFEKYKPVICFEPNAEQALLNKLASEIVEDLFQELKGLDNIFSKDDKIWGNEQFWGQTPSAADWDNDTATLGNTTAMSTISGGSAGVRNMSLRKFLKYQTQRTSVVDKVEVTIAELL